MRIAILGTFYPFRGGIAQFLEILAERLEAKGHTIKIFNFLTQYPKLIFPGKEQLDKSYKHFNFEKERILTPHNPISWYKTYQSIKKWQPDILILKYWIPYFALPFGFIVSKIKRNTNTKVFYIIDNIDFHEKWFAGEKLTRYALSKADCLVTMSSSVQKDAERLFPNNKIEKLFHPIYEGFNKERYTRESAKRKLNLSNNYNLLFFGFIKKYKGLDNLLRAMPMILQKIPNAHLIIAGEVYGNDKQYFDLIKELDLSENVSFYNRYISDDEVELFFKAADVLVLPYIQATQSGVLNVAYDMMLPVVATPVGSLYETVGKPKTGLIAKSVKANDIAKTIVEYKKTDKEIFLRNIEREKEKYSWNRFCEKLIELSK